MSNNRKVRKGLKQKPIERMPRKTKPIALPAQINRYNAYYCPVCKTGYRSRDLNAGVTPMFSPCFTTQGCRGQARSLMYNVVGTPAERWPVRIEWYAPVIATIGSLSYEMKRHVEQGGLLRRAAPEAPEWVKTIA